MGGDRVAYPGAVDPDPGGVDPDPGGDTPGSKPENNPDPNPLH